MRKKTKDQLEIELNELKQRYGEKCRECDSLTKDNIAKSKAATSMCADLKNVRKYLEDARLELSTKEASNKKLADQFYDYRTELDKVRKELADALENRNSLKFELEGVRGALKREAEMRTEAKKKCDELCEKLVKMGNEFEAYRKSFNDKDIECDKYRREVVKWKNEAGAYHNGWDSIRMENGRLRNELNEVEKIQRKHNKLTLESLDNALKQWNYIDGKLSHDLCMPLESLIQLLDEYGVNDFCKLRDRLTYAPTAAYSNVLAQVRKLEKENKDLKAVADDLEKQRKDALVELEHKREDVESLKTSLADSCAAKIKEGRDLTSKIESLKEDLKKMADSRDWYVKEAAKLRGWYDNLKKLYDKARKEGEEGCTMWREDSWKNRDERDRYKRIYEAAARKNDELQCEVNRLTQKVQDFEKRLPGTCLALPRPDDEICGRKIKEWMGYHAVLVKYGIPSPESLDAKLDPFEPARLTATKSYHVMKNWCVNDEKDLDNELGLLSRYRGVVEKYGVGGPEELDRCLDQRQRMHHTLHVLKKDIEQFNQP